MPKSIYDASYARKNSDNGMRNKNQHEGKGNHTDVGKVMQMFLLLFHLFFIAKCML